LGVRNLLPDVCALHVQSHLIYVWLRRQVTKPPLGASLVWRIDGPIRKFQIRGSGVLHILFLILAPLPACQFLHASLFALLFFLPLIEAGFTAGGNSRYLLKTLQKPGPTGNLEGLEAV
jgi:hypothetical protein